MALDEATTALLTQMAQAEVPPLEELSPQQARALSKAMAAQSIATAPEMLTTRETDEPGVPVRVLVPGEAPPAVIVYYHGGGWVLADIDQYDTLGRRLAARTGCAVVLVDYRKAPEHPYPAAVEDSWAALRWTADHLEEIAGAPVPLVVAGDSAGGNLSAVMARRARDHGGPAVALQILIYPVTDCDLETDSYRDLANQLMLTRDGMAWFWNHYLPDLPSREDADASPLRAKNLSGLAPAVVLTAEHDVLRDEGEAYAERLREAGVPVELRRFDGQMHGFFTMIGLLPGSGAAFDLITESVDRHV
ncbi:alpha/beta hydrolase [Nonomuraea africana]|uniref:Acetyl esterase n=1 Tax=Nonomuraea africana TaxID=46171 RepID=A0ABR9KVM1_9ACTN|nr:alpha/beta hydrolase [Nonomuraea africana]MBE1566075.1 acetyl esterase [Nonomuraea africana]